MEGVESRPIDLSKASEIEPQEQEPKEPVDKIFEKELEQAWSKVEGGMFLSEIIQFLEEFKQQHPGANLIQQIEIDINNLSWLLQDIRKGEFLPDHLKIFTRKSKLRDKIKVATAREIKHLEYFTKVSSVEAMEEVLDFLRTYCPVPLYLNPAEDLDVDKCFSYLRLIKDKIAHHESTIPGAWLSAFPTEYGLKYGIMDILEKKGIRII